MRLKVLALINLIYELMGEKNDPITLLYQLYRMVRSNAAKKKVLEVLIEELKIDQTEGEEKN